MALNQHPTTADPAESRWQAYRESCELLLGFRKIVQRALERVHGGDWLSSACPGELLDTLEQRQSMELEVERSSAVGDDIIHYTTFNDLAELVESDDALAAMLAGLSSSPDGLGGNLRTLEDIRRKIASARLLSDAESYVLSEMHLRLREKLAGARRRARGASPELGAVQPSTDDPPAPIDEGTAAPSGEQRAVDTDGTESEVVSGPEAVPESAVVHPTRRAASSRAAEVLDGAATPVGLVHVAEQDLDVLRELRLEIIAAAEAAYGYSDAIDTTVWTREWESGWFEERMEAYGLGDVSTFYAVMERYLERHRRGDNRESLRRYLADHELAKLLLRLRELFVRLRI